ncbi:MAG: hypothetical protein JW956_02620 [Calditrichaceae bacterium]|nr:hypothetical protein [Calditrichaceae bacterium]
MRHLFSNYVSYTISRITKTNRILVLVICIIGLSSFSSFSQPLAQRQDKFIGCSLNYTIYSNFDDYWNQVTPENAGKWGSVEYSQD